MTTASAPAVNPDAQAFKSAVRAQWERSAQGWNAHPGDPRLAASGD